MYSSNVLIEIRISTANGTDLKEFIASLKKSILPNSIQKGYLKLYSFQASPYDSNRNIYISSINHWVQLLLQQTDQAFYYQMTTNTFYFDCLRYRNHLLINIILHHKKFHKIKYILSNLSMSSTITISDYCYNNNPAHLNIKEFAEKQSDKFLHACISLDTLSSLFLKENN